MGAEASRRLPPARWPAEPGVQSSAPGVRCPGPCGRPQRRSPREPAAWARAREFRPPRPAGTPHMATRLFSRHFLRWAPPSGTLCRGLTDGRGGPEEPGAARLVVCGVGGRPVRGAQPREGGARSDSLVALRLGPHRLLSALEASSALQGQCVASPGVSRPPYWVLALATPWTRCPGVQHHPMQGQGQWAGLAAGRVSQMLPVLRG